MEIKVKTILDEEPGRWKVFLVPDGVAFLSFKPEGEPPYTLDVEPDPEQKKLKPLYRQATNTVNEPKAEVPIEEKKETAPVQNRIPVAKTPWAQALQRAEAKMLAITGEERRVKIELGFAMQQIQNNPTLMQCDPESIFDSVVNVSRTNITLNPILKLAYLVPRRKKGKMMCCLDFDYKGLVKILKDNKCVNDFRARIVYEGETFEESTNPTVAHVHKVIHAKTEAEHKSREKIGVYGIATLPNGMVIFTELMPNWHVMKVKKVSPAAKEPDSIWNNWEESMYMKTKLRYDWKLLISGEPNESVLNALEIDNDAFDPPAGQVAANFIDERNELIAKMQRAAAAGDEDTLKSIWQNNQKFSQDPEFIQASQDGHRIIAELKKQSNPV